MGLFVFVIIFFFVYVIAPMGLFVFVIIFFFVYVIAPMGAVCCSHLLVFFIF